MIKLRFLLAKEQIILIITKFVFIKKIHYMGLFDFLFGKSKNKVSSECIEQASNSDDDFVVVNIMMILIEKPFAMLIMIL